MSNRPSVPLALRRKLGALVRQPRLQDHQQEAAAAQDRLRAEIVAARDVQVFLDVGANEGLFAGRLRASGYRERMVSFEPLTAMFAKLEAAAAGDDAWECHRVALGARSGTATLHIAANWASSSLLEMNARHSLAEPRSAYVDTEECTVATLDSLREVVLRPGERAYLKLDVQGSELEVLCGAEQTLQQVQVLQAELSLVPLYDGAPLFGDVVRYLDERGFGLLGLEPAFVHPGTGAILQVDGLFARVDT